MSSMVYLRPGSTGTSIVRGTLTGRPGQAGADATAAKRLGQRSMTQQATRLVGRVVDLECGVHTRDNPPHAAQGRRIALVPRRAIQADGSRGRPGGGGHRDTPRQHAGKGDVHRIRDERLDEPDDVLDRSGVIEAAAPLRGETMPDARRDAETRAAF